MQHHLAVRAVESPADINQLRAWLQNEAGDAAVHEFEQHLVWPRYRPGFTLLAAQPDGPISGVAFLRHERLRLGPAMLETGMLSLYGAALHHAAGITALLDAALGVLHEQGLPLLLLHGAAAQFGAFGFAPVTLQHATTLDASVHNALIESATYALRQEALPNASDLDDLAALYEVSYQNLPLSHVRVAPDWRAWLAAQRDMVMVEDRQRRLGGYACIVPHMGGMLHIHEAAAADAGAARALLQALVERAHVGGHPAVLLDLPLRQLVTQAALHSGGEARARTVGDEEDTILAGIVDLGGLLDMLRPALAERLHASRYADWSGALRIETEAEQVGLAVTAGAIAVVDGAQPADVRLRRVSLPGLAQLGLGYRSAADLRATGDLDCDDQALGLIDTLFPVVFL